MSETFEAIIDRAVKDATFRDLLLSNPTAALQGYSLSSEEQAMLTNLDATQLDEFAGGLGDRTTKGRWVPGA
jgi:hypothetical protein